MAETTAISGNARKNNGGTVLHGGNIDNVVMTRNLTLATNAHDAPVSGPKLAVSPTESGNLGTLTALSTGAFAQMEAGEYVGKIIGDRVAQTDNTILRSGAAETPSRRALHYGKGNHRYNITSWDYVTGAATKGGNAGDSFTYVDPVTGSATDQEPYPTYSVPGELVYMDGDLVPTQADYSARTI